MGNHKLILLPGLDGTGNLFEPLINEIQNERSIEVISYPLNEALTYSELVSFVGNKIENENSIYIVAESFSGVIALNLLKKYKNKIEGIILVASFITPPHKHLLKLSSLLPVKSLLKFEIPNFLIRRYCLGSEVAESVIIKFKSIIKLVNPNVLVHRINEIKKLTNKELLSNNSCKITYIQALNDKLVQNRCLKELSSVVTLETEVVAGPHFLLQAKPKECAKIILKNTKP